MKTIISHFYNEEYLLPWWLKHHKQFFDHGILIDYQSTDDSVSIIKEICPTWDVVRSRNNYFDAKLVDEEVEYYESQIDGWKIALNTTEFLHGNFSKLDVSEQFQQYFIPSIPFVDNPNEKENYPDQNIPIHKQIRRGIPIINTYDLTLRRYSVNEWVFTDSPHSYTNHNPTRLGRFFRSLHNYDIKYPLGRHFWPTNSLYNIGFSGNAYGWKNDEKNCDEHPLKIALSSEFMIFYYGFAPYNQKVFDRKIQIQNKIPNSNIKNGIGSQHIIDQKTLNEYWKMHYKRTFDLTDMMSIYISKEDYLDIRFFHY